MPFDAKLKKLQHPHTGENLANCLESSLETWKIPTRKVMMVVSDKGANMVKAIRLLQECAQAANTDDKAGVRKENEGEESETKQENENEDEDDGTHTIRTDEDTEDETESEEEEVDIIVKLPEEVPYRRSPCMAHTMQLVVKEAYGHNQYSNIIAKAKRVVSTIRRSSIVVEELVNRCGRSVIADCITRWNCTYFMTKRLLTIRQDVNYALNHIGENSLLASEWNRLEELTSLLELIPSRCQLYCLHYLSWKNICIKVCYLILLVQQC